MTSTISIRPRSITEAKIFAKRISIPAVNADLDYRAKAVIPDIGVGKAFNFNPMSEWIDGTLTA